MRKLTLNLTPRADGRFAKRIDGEYFVWPDEKTARAAIIELARRRDAGFADTYMPAIPSDPPLRIIANLFRADRKPNVKPGTWKDYETAIDQFLAVVGKNRPASNLKPADFADARKRWGKLGPWKLDNRIQSVRTMFKWAAEVSKLIEDKPWYGDAFHKTSKAEKRRAAREHTAVHGERVFTANELRKILNAATGPLYAFILLGLNGGMYAADIAQLKAADLRKIGKDWIIDNDREKTDVRRKFILWPETVEAIEACRRGADTLFVTSHGNPWVNGDTNSITLLFNRLLNKLGVKRSRVGFGALRHTHVSAVGAHPDMNAARLVRGHEFGGIESHYDFPDLKRIRAVTNLARMKLFTTLARQTPSRKKSA